MKHAWVLFFLACSPFLYAQSGQRPVGLKEAIGLAVENSAQLKKARLDRQGWDAKLREKRSAALPQVNAGVNFDAFPLLPTQFIPGEVLGRPDGSFVPVQFGRPWQLTGVFNVEQALYNEASRRSIPAIGATNALYDLLIERTEEEVRYNTATLFYQTLQTQQMLRAVDANAAKIDALLRMAELQLANGYATPTDVKRIRVARTNLETQRENLLAGISALRQTLQFMCGVPFDTPFDPQEALEHPAADSARWFSLILQPERTTESRLLAKQLELNRIQVHSAKADNWPILSGYATGWLQSQRGATELFDLSKRWFGMAAVGAKLQLPLFDGFRHRRKTVWLDIEAQKIETDRQQLSEAKQLEFRQAGDQLRSALRSLRTQTDNVALAREIIDKLTLQYREGIAPLTDLLNAQTALAEAESNYWQQVFTYKLAVLKLLKSSGQLGML